MTTDYSALYEAHHAASYGQTADIAGRLVSLGITHQVAMANAHHTRVVRVVRMVVAGETAQMLPILVYAPHIAPFEGHPPEYQLGDALEFRGARLTRTNIHYTRDWCLGRPARGRAGIVRAREPIPGEFSPPLSHTPIALGDVAALSPVEAPLVAVSGDVVTTPSFYTNSPTPIELSDPSGRRRIWFQPETTHLVRGVAVGDSLTLERVHLIGYKNRSKSGGVLRAGADTMVDVERDLTIPSFTM